MTNLEAIDYVYAFAKTTQLKAALTGNLYKIRRPVNSALEDIVISALPMSDGNPQRCTVNVNIHIPDKQVSISSRQQQMPDYSRMKQLAILAETEFKEYSSQSYSWYMSYQQVFSEETINQTYINVRLEFSAHNL